MTWRVLVPVSLHDESVAELLDSADDVEVSYALPADERVMGGGAAGPLAQREKVEAVYWDRASDFEVLGAMAGKPFITAELLDRCPDVKIVFIASAGTDSIDLEAATARGIAVVNAAGNNIVPVSEHTIGLLLALSRKIALADRRAHAERRSLHFTEVGAFPGVLDGKTLGLVGCGAIGRRVAAIASRGFGMRVVVFDPFLVAEAADEMGVELVGSLDELLDRSDAVSLHLPLTEETRHTIGRSELARMKDGAFLVNTSRGGTVDTDALVEALTEGRIGGAGLDVTDPEPLPADHPLQSLDNVVLTPHLAGAAPEAILMAYTIAAQGVVDAVAGRKPQTLVNPEVWQDFLNRRENNS
jgi:D-3-phosphoglycerate dehydrogenase